METILTYLVSGFDFVQTMINFGIKHPDAAAFWAGVTMVLLNIIVKYTPTKVDDSILSAVTRAVSEGLTRVKAKK